MAEEASGARQELPAWRRQTRGEPSWPAFVALLVAIGLQLVLPDKLALSPKWALPALTGVLMVVLALVNPGRLDRHRPRRRLVALSATGLASAGNAVSGALLVQRIITGSIGDEAGPLLAGGAAIYCTNIVLFSLWYWEFDRGGPGARAEGAHDYPDFLFPQMSDQTLAPRDWEPGYLDYLYLSFTNATAFSPTDVMPLRHWAKLTMLVQSALSLVLIGLVVAREVNILH